MIGVQTELQVADNTGAKRIECIKVLGGSKRRYSHPVLKKVIKVRKNYNAHDENNTFKTGDKVSIIESKSFSKNKKFQVMENNK